MGDPEVAGVVAEAGTYGTTVLEVAPVDGRLPVAQARNTGTAWALTAGADSLVFLDVDCIPAPDLIARYAAATAERPGALLSGPVGYLPRRSDGGDPLDNMGELARPHPARPPLRDDSVQAMSYELFWSLSFALDAATWTAIGGFCERYTGYGGEDTDFAQLARIRGVSHLGIGGAWAYHQWHPSTRPPVQHLHDILRNAAIFHDRWGWWPMSGWLHDFQKLGLARYDAANDKWTLAGARSPVSRP